MKPNETLDFYHSARSYTITRFTPETCTFRRGRAVQMPGPQVVTQGWKEGFIAVRPDRAVQMTDSQIVSRGWKKNQSIPNPHSSLSICYEPALRQPVTMGSFADAYPLLCLHLPSSLSFAAATYFVLSGSSLNDVTPDLNGFACISPSDDARTTIEFVEPSMQSYGQCRFTWIHQVTKASDFDDHHSQPTD